MKDKESFNKEYKINLLETRMYLLNNVNDWFGGEKERYLFKLIEKHFGIENIFGKISTLSDKEDYYDAIEGKAFKWLGTGVADIYNQINKTASYDKKTELKQFLSRIDYIIGIVKYPNIFDEKSFRAIPLLKLTIDNNEYIIDGTVQQFFYPQIELPKGLLIMNLSEAKNFYDDLIFYNKKEFANIFDSNIFEEIESKHLKNHG